MEGQGRKQIKSVKQLADQMKQAKQQFDMLINCLGIPNLNKNEDLLKENPTIQMVLKDLPSENRLKQMLENAHSSNRQHRQGPIIGYNGKYEIIRKARDNISNLKPQAEKIYLMASLLDLYKIQEIPTSELEQAKSKLKNAEVYFDQKLRVPRIEKNTISPNYLRELKAEELRTTTHATNADCIQLGQPLLHVNLYDSINGEKTHQYVCYGQQTLYDLVKSFYCLIARLENKEQQHYFNSYFLIEDCFYYHGIQAKKKIEELVSFQAQGQSPQMLKILQMSKVKVKNLRVVFGRPYLFRHLQGCDHLIIFKDLRILTEQQASDPIKQEKYPLVVFEGRMRRRKCQGCKSKFAQLVSLNDPLKAGKHLYVCGDCHTNLHGEAADQTQTFIRYIHD